MKELKQKMTLAYNYAHGRDGDPVGGALSAACGWRTARRCARWRAYIDLNPIRAGLADEPEGYRWCSYAAAVGGMKLARAGLVEAIAPGASSPGRRRQTRIGSYCM